MIFIYFKFEGVFYWCNTFNEAESYKSVQCISIMRVCIYIYRHAYCSIIRQLKLILNRSLQNTCYILEKEVFTHVLSSTITKYIEFSKKLKLSVKEQQYFFRISNGTIIFIADKDQEKLLYVILDLGQRV